MKMDVITRQRERDHRKAYLERDLPGDSVKNSACGKDHEEGGLAYEKAGSSLRSPLGNSRASTPQNQSVPTFCFVLSPTPLTLRGAVPPTSFREGVNLEL